MTSSHFAKLLAGTAILSAAFMLAPETAAAQSAADQASSNQIGEIIVTARKREENVQTIPVAVSVTTGEQLAQHGVSDLYALQTLVPSLNARALAGPPQPGAPSFSIRGVGTAIIGPQIESSVGIVVDDVAMMKGELANIHFFDIERIEVLRGPQGMLFGKNASAGLINIVTSDPVLESPNILTHVQYGNMNAPTAGHTYQLDVAGNLPLSDTMALRVGAFIDHKDGFIEQVNVPSDQDYSDTSMWGVRGKLLWEPSDAVRMTLAGDYAHLTGLGEAVEALDSLAPGGYAATVLQPGSGVTASRTNKYAANGPQDARYFVWGVSHKTELDIGAGFTLTNILAYRARRSSMTYDISEFNLPGDVQTPRTYYHQTSEELRLTSPDYENFNFQAGLFYMDYTGWLDVESAKDLGRIGPTVGLPGVFPPGVLYYHLQLRGTEHTKSTAAYIEGTFKATESLSVTAGARYTHDDLHFNTYLFNHPDATLFAVGPGYNLTNTEIENNLSYRASVNYRLTDDIFTYATYSRGYKGPGFNQLFVASLVKPEIPTSYEVGLKTTFFDRRLLLNLAAFDTTFKNFQVYAIQVVEGTTTGLSTNAGKLLTRGFEADAVAKPIDGLTLTGAMTYLDAKYQNLRNLPCYAGEPAGTGPGQCNYATGLTNSDGLSLAKAPKWAGNLSARYEAPLTDKWLGFVQGEVAYTGSYFMTPDHNPFTKQKAYTVFGLAAGASSADGRLDVKLFVRNLTDERVPINIGVSQIEGNSYTHQFNSDSYRTIGISLDYRLH